VFTLQTDYDVIEETDPQEAIEIVKRQPIDVVISDFLMPQMNGIDFLKEVRSLQPEAARLLLTGYADKENAIRAINDVGLYHYIEKPWDNQAMLNIIRNALKERSLRAQLAGKISDLDKLLRDYGELETRHRFLEREMEMAGRVQRSLLPDSFPSLDGFRFANLYRPCEAVGGDFYDYAGVGDRTTILVSDVIGHGVQAALSTMLLKGIFQETATQIGEPVELLKEMNARLHRIIPEGMYAAASVIMLEPGSAELCFANAGLPYPFVLRSADKRVDEIPLAGPPLGLFGDIGIVPYEARSSKLESGDVFLIGSDGIGSIEGGDDEIFEDHRLRRVLNDLVGLDGEKVIDQLMEQATVFSNGRALPDDVNLVTITRG
jgi:sigma-B regulation protein RsbU (phosphoserine phosphatase)